MNIIEKTKNYYQQNNKIYGKGSPLNLWATEERQLKRFEQIIKIIDLNNQEILDVGCGYGDFYNWLINKNIFPKSYLGVDLLEEHCEIAISKLPTTCSILCGDFLEQKIDFVQYCILSGTLNFYDKGWLKIAHKILDKMWYLSTLGIVFNLRSSHYLTGTYNNKDVQIKETAPSYWCSYAHSKTANYALYHNYVSYDYTIAMWK